MRVGGNPESQILPTEMEALMPHFNWLGAYLQARPMKLSTHDLLLVQASAMEATSLAAALREEVAAACRQRDELAARLAALEAPRGALSQLHEVETALQRVGLWKKNTHCY